MNTLCSVLIVLRAIFVVAVIFIAVVSVWSANSFPWYGWVCVVGAIVSFGVGEIWQKYLDEVS